MELIFVAFLILGVFFGVIGGITGRTLTGGHLTSQERGKALSAAVGGIFLLYAIFFAK